MKYLHGDNMRVLTSLLPYEYSSEHACSNPTVKDSFGVLISGYTYRIKAASNTVEVYDLEDNLIHEVPLFTKEYDDLSHQLLKLSNEKPFVERINTYKYNLQVLGRL